MPFKSQQSQLSSTLTETQSSALAKVNSLQTYMKAPENPFKSLSLPEEDQISTFDLSTKLLGSLSGPQSVDKVLKEFLDKVFEIDKIAPESTSGATSGATSGVASGATNGGTIASNQTPTVNTSELPWSERQLLNSYQYKYEANVLLENSSGLPYSIEVIIDNNVGIPGFSKEFSIENYTTQSAIESMEALLDSEGYFFDESLNYKKTGTFFDNPNSPPAATSTGTTPQAASGASPEATSGATFRSVVGGANSLIGDIRNSDSFLEDTIITALANSLDVRGKYLAPQPKAGSTIPLSGDNISVSGGTFEPAQQVEGFSQFSNLEYLFTSSAVQATGSTSIPGVTEDITIDVQTNIPEKLPSFTQFYPASENALSTEEILEEVTYNANNNGFYENDISYPKSGTLIDLIPVLTGDIVGTVTDISGEKIPSVKIELLNTQPIAKLRTDVEGNFTINNLKKGKYNIKASSTSFEDAIVQSFEVKQNENNTLNFQLKFTGATASASATTNNPNSVILDASGNTIETFPELPTLPPEELDSNIPIGVLAPSPSIQVTDPYEFSFNESGEFSNVFEVDFNQDDVGLTNKEYLNKYLKPALTAGKRALVGKIIAMIFGPKETMSKDPEEQEMLLNSAACGEKLFSVSNSPTTEKEIEFNRVNLKRQLENGKIELTISCQKIEIKLPENYMEEFDLEPSEVPEIDRPNPANSFTLLANYVQTETQRQRNQEDASAVNKTFFEIIVEKIMQYISVAFSVSPEISAVFDILNSALAGSGEEPESPASLLSNPCDTSEACDSGNKKEFEEKSTFATTMINSLYSLALSIIIKKLITEAKAQIKKLIAKKAKEKIEKLKRKHQNRFKTLETVTSTISKADEYKSAFGSSGISDIMNFRNDNNA